MNHATPQPPNCEIFILAGGLSARMGRDKSRLRLGSRTMLEHVREAAMQAGVPVRIIRRDAVARCGPIGGIYTALKRSRAETILFLACDMPFVSPMFLKKMIHAFHERGVAAQGASARPGALFAREGNRAGFPCMLRRAAVLDVVSRQIQNAEFSLQSLAKKLKAKTIHPAHSPMRQLTNINTPADFKKAARQIK